MSLKKRVLRSTWPRVRRVIKNGRESYVVDTRPIGGREFWSTLRDALASAERIAHQRANDGAASFDELSPSERRDAAEALALLDGEGSLLDAVRLFVRETSFRKKLASVPLVSEALTVYLDTKQAELARGELSKLTVDELQSNARIICQAFGSVRVAEVTEAAVASFAAKLPQKPQGRKNIVTKLLQFFNFCVRQKWIAMNPAANVKVKVRTREVEILSIDQVRRLLLAAGAADPASGVLPFIALQLYAGLRPFEAAQLRWESIHFETSQIEVKAATSKTRQTRFVPIETCLAELLLPRRRPLGLIPGPHFEKILRSVKKEAGLIPWPVDVLRHCYGSYWLAVNKDRAHLAELMGNSLSVIRQHYRRAIPEATAREYWHLLGGKIVEFPSAQAG